MKMIKNTIAAASLLLTLGSASAAPILFDF